MPTANVCTNNFPLAPKYINHIAISTQQNSERSMPPIIYTSSITEVQIRYSMEPNVLAAKDRYRTPIPKEINYIWLGRTFDDFDQTPIQQCVRNNPDYRIRIWLDDFSMLDMEGPRGLPKVLPSASLNIYKSGMNKPISSSDISKTFAMLVRAQIEFYKVHLKHHLRAYIPTIQSFQAFLQEHELYNVDILFLSNFYAALFHAEHEGSGNSLSYPSLSPSPTASRWENLGPEVKLLQWVFFERYRGNYAAASNLLRVQLLQTYPGIYVDHHTTVPSIRDLTGFRFALTADKLPSQTFLASAPNHPCLQYFRLCILQKYEALLKNNFNCVTLDYTTMEKPTDPYDFLNPYNMEIHALSGPGAFFRAMKDVAEGALGENVDISGAAMRGVGVNATMAKGSSLDDGKDEQMADEDKMMLHTGS